MCSLRVVFLSGFISCTFLSPPLVTNSFRALASCGRTLANWPTTCFKMLGGASLNRGSKAGRCTHFWRMLVRAFLDWKNKEQNNGEKMIWVSQLIQTTRLKCSTVPGYTRACFTVYKDLQIMAERKNVRRLHFTRVFFFPYVILSYLRLVGCAMSAPAFNI